MTDEDTRPTPPQEPAESPPPLPADFFARLLDLPACKSKGYCDNCGRCER